MNKGFAGMTRRRFLASTAAVGAATVLAPSRHGAPAQGAKATISFWNGLTGADGKVMDDLIGQFTKETGIAVEQQRIVWPDLYAKLQVSTPAGEGPDICLIHTVEVPHFASDRILEAIDDRTLAAKGFRGEDYLPSPWNGGTYQGKRYTIPLDVPQHIFFLNPKLLKAAGFANPDGSLKLPGSKDELLQMGAKLTSGDVFGFAMGSGANIGRYTWSLHNLLWQNGANIFTPDLKKCALTDPAATEAAEFWGAIYAKNKIATPANANPRDAFIAGKVAMWIAGSWNVAGLREAKVDFAVAPVPKLFKQPIVFTIPHQFSFPKPKTQDAARREAAWTLIRWITDHVADWTLRAGQVSANRKSHTDPRITGDPALRTLLAQGPYWQHGQSTPKWVPAENLTRPVVESVYIGQKAAKEAMADLARQINALPD
jgi:multiple sugar transport system substrate-binding protein